MAVNRGVTSTDGKCTAASASGYNCDENDPMLASEGKTRRVCPILTGLRVWDCSLNLLPLLLAAT